MALLETITITCDGWTEFTFAHPASRYKVKNFSENDAFVSFESKSGSDATTGCQKLPADYCDEYEVKQWTGMSMYPTNYAFDTVRTDKVYIKGTGDIEVSQV